MEIPFWVAAHNQYLVGLKTKLWMISPASREYKCFPSLRSHNMVVPSLPPLAQRDPSGETVTVFTYPVCPIKLVFNLQFCKFQTFTTLSHPPEMMTGLWV